MFKKNDILIYRNGKSLTSLVYVLGETIEGYVIAKVTLEECTKVKNTNLISLNEQGLITYLDNREVPQMEIMNLTDDYPEYFI